MSGSANDAAAQLLAELKYVTSDNADIVRPMGASLLHNGSIVCLAGFTGATFAAPQAIEAHLRSAGKVPPAPFVVLTNDPYAGGISLNHLFLIGRPAEGGRALVAALLLEDFGAMREGVFRHRREIFHEGLRLPSLPVDWNSPDRNILLDTVTANVRHPDVVHALIDRSVRVLLAACHELHTPTSRPSDQARRSPFVQGHGKASASVDGGSCATVHADLHASADDCEIALSISGEAEPPLCPNAAAHSAAALALADAWNLPILRALDLIRLSNPTPHGIVATFPAAVSHESAGVTYACYCAVFEAAQKIRPAATSPRERKAFVHFAPSVAAPNAGCEIG